MDHEALLNTTEAARHVGVLPATIRRWAHDYPSSLPVRNRDGRGRPLYRAGDVVEVEWATRTSYGLLAERERVA